MTVARRKLWSMSRLMQTNYLLICGIKIGEKKYYSGGGIYLRTCQCINIFSPLTKKCLVSSFLVFSCRVARVGVFPLSKMCYNVRQSRCFKGCLFHSEHKFIYFLHTHRAIIERPWIWLVCFRISASALYSIFLSAGHICEIWNVAALMVLGRERCRTSGPSRVLSAALLRFINAAITGDSSPLLFLTRCHLLSLESYWKCLCVPSSCVPLSFYPVFWRLSLSVSPPTLFLFCLCWLRFHLLESSLFCRVFCFLCVTFVHAYLPLSRVVTPPSARACRHQRRYQTGCPLRLHKVMRKHETRKDVSRVATSTS